MFNVDPNGNFSIVKKMTYDVCVRDPIDLCLILGASAADLARLSGGDPKAIDRAIRYRILIFKVAQDRVADSRNLSSALGIIAGLASWEVRTLHAVIGWR